MRTFKMTTPVLTILGFFALGSTLAVAQAPGGAPPPPPQPRTGPGYYASPPPGPAYGQGFHFRRGLTVGLSFGVGGMDSDTGALDSACAGCGYNPIAGGFSGHIGVMLNPRLALLIEGFTTIKSLDAGGFTYLEQDLGLIAAQWWASPKLWIKGGIGVAMLSENYDDGYYVYTDVGATGGAVMGAVGYEVLSAPRFSVDLQARLAVASYESFRIVDQIQAFTVGAGVNWF